MSKTPLLVVILIGLISVGCTAVTPTPTPALTSSPARATAPIKSGKIRYFDNANLDVRDVPILMALDALQAQGYTVERQSLATSALLIDALTRGDADVISANTQNVWTAIGKGANLRTFIAKQGSTLILESKQEIKTCADLGRKAVAVPATTGTNPAMLDLYIQKNCPSAKLQLVVVADIPARIAGLEAGQLDAALLQSEQLVQLDHDAPGKFHTLAALYKEFSEVQNSALHFRREWAQQNPEAAKDFVRAVLQANRKVSAEPQVLYDEAVKRLKLDAATAKQVGDAYLQAGIWDPNGGLTADNIQYTIDFLTDLKALPAGVKVDDVADLSYLNAVLDEMGRK